jgi:hypothetical protein
VLASAPLSAAVESLLAADDSPEPLLTRNHLSALDVRLRSVLVSKEYLIPLSKSDFAV